MSILLALLMWMHWSASVKTTDPLATLPDNMILDKAGDCTDQVTHEKGSCMTFVDSEKHDVYIVFGQDGKLQFIRKFHGNEPYVTTYVPEDFATY